MWCVCCRSISANDTHPLHGDWIFTCAKKTGRNPETGEVLDWGYVGDPIAVDVRSVHEMLDAGIVPVVTPLGTGEESHGMTYDVNAEHSGCGVSQGHESPQAGLHF